MTVFAMLSPVPTTLHLSNGTKLVIATPLADIPEEHVKEMEANFHLVSRRATEEEKQLYAKQTAPAEDDPAVAVASITQALRSNKAAGGK